MGIKVRLRINRDTAPAETLREVEKILLNCGVNGINLIEVVPFSPTELDEEGAKGFNYLLSDIRETYDACYETARRKNADYAGEGADPFRNFRNSTIVGVSVQKGILVRLMDKMSRVSNLLEQEAQVKDESITDTIDDAINYLAILKSSIKNKIK